MAIVLLALYAGVIYYYKNHRCSITASALLALALVALEAAANTAVTSVPTTSRTAYQSDNEAITRLTKALRKEEPFFRVKRVDGRTKNDGAWMNFPSASLFSSLASADTVSYTHLDVYKRQGGACQDTCCASWQIGADPVSLKRYKKEKGEFRERLRDGIDGTTGEFRMKDGRCPFLNERCV